MRSDAPDGAAYFAYERIAGAIATRITNGDYPAGARLPSVRRLARLYDVSVPTAMQAYRLLEARRLVAARPRSGFFVLERRPPRSRSTGPRMVPSDVTTEDLIMRFLETNTDPRLVPLGTAIPDASLLPAERLGRALAAVARRASGSHVTMANPAGTEELRREIAQRSVGSRAPYGADDVVVTAGAAEAVTLSLAELTRPGDSVIVESPAYFGTLQAMRALGLRAIEVPTDMRTGISLGHLTRALRLKRVSAIVLTPNVHNPLGFVMGDREKRALARLLDEHDVPVIEDDTYAELHYGPERPPSLRAFSRSGRVLSVGSFSKTLAPAYRIGWVVPGRHHDAIVRRKAALSVTTAAPTQLALAALLRNGGYDHHLRRLKRALSANVEHFTAVAVRCLPPGTRMTKPDGGFLLWVELPQRVDSLRLYDACFRAGIGIAPGPVFSATGHHANCIRLNAGLLVTREIEDAIATIGQLAARLLRSAQ